MRRWRWLAGAAVGIAAIVAARACWPELPDPLPRAARSHAGRSLDGAAIDGESADESGDDATLEADRLPEAAAPVPAGSTRYRMKFVKPDGTSLTIVRVGVLPEAASEARSITPVPGGVAVLDFDSACRAVDFSARGYVDVHHVIDARERERRDLGAIVFVPAATIDLRVVGAPRHSLPWLIVSAWTLSEASNGSTAAVVCGDATFATPDGTGRASFAVPSDTETRLDFTGEGIAVRSTRPSLAAGTTTWTVDFASFAKIRGRVVGVPPACARGADVWLQLFVPERDGLFPGMDASVALDEEARFEFAAVPDGPFSLRLDSAGLRETGGEHREAWRTEDLASGRDLELEPDRKLLGVEIGPLEGRRGRSGGHRLQFDDPESSDPWTRATDDRRLTRGLVLASALRAATHLVVDSGTDDPRIVEVARLPPPREGVVVVDLDRFPRSRGRVVVSWNWLASRDWRLHLTDCGRTFGDPRGPPPARHERGLFEDSFVGLPPGCYDVWASWHQTLVRRVASGIELAPDEERRVDVKLPSPNHRAGRVTNWSELEPALRPHEIAFESDDAVNITDGRFEADVAPPLRTAHFTFTRSDRIDATAPVATDEDGDLAVRFPVEEFDVFALTVQLAPGERAIAFCVGADAPQTIGPYTELRRAVDADGRIALVHRRGASLRGWIVSFRPGDSTRRFAWFSSDVPPGIVIPAGRFVDATNGRDGTAASLTLVARPVAGWTPPRLPLCKLIYGLPRRIWIPDGAEFVDVESSGCALRRFECAKVGARWDVGGE